MTSLGFENYSEALKIYLARYREVSCPLLSFRLCPFFCHLPCIILAQKAND
jgi:nuclear transcription Y subunit beta